MKRSLHLLALMLALAGCHPSASDLVEDAEREALEQRSQLAQHLYSQALKAKRASAHDRLRAYRGLAELAFNQLHDYPMGVAAVLKASEELKTLEADDKKSLREMQMRAAQVARLQIQDDETAVKLVGYFERDTDLTAVERLEVARAYQAVQDLDRAETEFIRALETASAEKSCAILKRAHLDVIQIQILKKNFKSAIEWGERESLSPECKPDQDNVALEVAHSYEISGEPERALEIYAKLKSQDPGDDRIDFLIQGVRKRMRDKEVR